MKIAIVGARDFTRLDLVEQFIVSLPKDSIVVSGGAKGVDAAAKEFGEKCGLEVLEYLPELNGCKARHELSQRYYERNQKIANACDRLVAFTDKDSGGTWDTVRRARALDKLVDVITSQCGICDNSAAFDFIFDFGFDTRVLREKTQSVYHMKAIGLGSYALHQRQHKTTEFLVEFIRLKDSDFEKLVDIMLPDFIKFFKEYNHGHITAITPAQRSERNIHKSHPMDLLCEKLSAEIDVPHVNLLETWSKPTRGIRNYTEKAKIVPEAINYKCGTVYVLDDVTTTGHTLKAACDALANIGIHCHGLAYIFWGGKI